jgi:hypothetical protein
MSKPNRTLAFLGFGRAKPAKAGDTEETKPADAAVVDQNDEEEEGEEEDEREQESDDDREVAVAAARAEAVAAERARIGAILSGVEPAQAELAVHLALNTDMSADQAKAALGKAGKGGARTAFADAMARTSAAPAPAFGGGKEAAKPSLAGRMAKLLERK